MLDLNILPRHQGLTGNHTALISASLSKVYSPAAEADRISSRLHIKTLYLYKHKVDFIVKQPQDVSVSEVSAVTTTEKGRLLTNYFLKTSRSNAGLFQLNHRLLKY